jgi:hypothetical protein
VQHISINEQVNKKSAYIFSKRKNFFLSQNFSSTNNTSLNKIIGTVDLKRQLFNFEQNLFTDKEKILIILMYKISK